MLKLFDTPNSYRKRHRLQDICWPDLAWRGNAVPIVLVFYIETWVHSLISHRATSPKKERPLDRAIERPLQRPPPPPEPCRVPLLLPLLRPPRSASAACPLARPSRMGWPPDVEMAHRRLLVLALVATAAASEPEERERGGERERMGRGAGHNDGVRSPRLHRPPPRGPPTRSGCPPARRAGDGDGDGDGGSRGTRSCRRRWPTAACSSSPSLPMRPPPPWPNPWREREREKE